LYFSDEEKFAKNELCGGTKSETSAIFTQMDEKNKNSEISDKKFRKILQNFSEQKKRQNYKADRRFTCRLLT
jgi:hypothetical protein